MAKKKSWDDIVKQSRNVQYDFKKSKKNIDEYASEARANQFADQYNKTYKQGQNISNNIKSGRSVSFDELSKYRASADALNVFKNESAMKKHYTAKQRKQINSDIDSLNNAEFLSLYDKYRQQREEEERKRNSIAEQKKERKKQARRYAAASSWIANIFGSPMQTTAIGNYQNQKVAHDVQNDIAAEREDSAIKLQQASARIDELYHNKLKAKDFAFKSKVDETIKRKDADYAYINASEKEREAMRAVKASTGNTGDISRNDRLLDTMTPDQIKIYNYIYKTEGKKKAKEYLDILASGENGMQALSNMEAEAAEKTQNNPLLMEGSRLLSQVGEGITSGASVVAGLTGSTAAENRFLQPSVASGGIQREIETEIGNKTQDMPLGSNLNIGGKDYGNLYTNAYKFLDSAGRSVISSVMLGGNAMATFSAKAAGGRVAQALITAPIAASAYGDQYYQARKNGASDYDAKKQAFVEAGIEWTTEVLGGFFGKEFNGVIGQMSNEALEELTGDIMNTGYNILDSLGTGKKNELQQEYEQLIAEGMSAKDAIKTMLARHATEEAITFVGTFLSMSPNVVGTHVANKVSMAKLGKAIQSGESEVTDLPTLVNVANALGEDTKAYKTLEKIVTSEKANSNTDIGQLYYDTIEDIQNTFDNAKDIKTLTNTMKKLSEAVESSNPQGMTNADELTVNISRLYSRAANRLITTADTDVAQTVKKTTAEAEDVNKAIKEEAKATKAKASSDNGGMRVAFKINAAGTQLVSVADSNSSDIVFNTADGREIPLSEIERGTVNGKQAAIIAEAQGEVNLNSQRTMPLGINGTETFISAMDSMDFNTNTELNQASSVLKAAWLNGYGTNNTYAQFKEQHEDYFKRIDESAIKAMYEAGAEDSAIETKVKDEASKKDRSKAVKKTKKTQGKVTGDADEALKFFEEVVAGATNADIANAETDVDSNANAQHQAAQDLLTLFNDNAREDRGEAFALVHEQLERVRAYNPEGYKAIVHSMLEYAISKTSTTAVARAAANYRAEYLKGDKFTTMIDANQEMVNDFCAALICGNETAQREYARWLVKNNDQSFVKKVKDIIERIVKALNDFLKRENLNAIEREFAEADAESAKRLVNLITAQMDVANSRANKFAQELAEALPDSAAAQHEAEVRDYFPADQAIADGADTYFNLKTLDIGLYQTYLDEQSMLDDSSKKAIIETLKKVKEVAEGINGQAFQDFVNWQGEKPTMIEDENGNLKYVDNWIVNNGEYVLNNDATTLCKKRMIFDRVLKELCDEFGTDFEKLKKEDFAVIKQIIRDAGYEVACDNCFVDSKRYRVLEWASSFTNTWNSLLDSLTDGTETFAAYESYLEGKEEVQPENSLHKLTKEQRQNLNFTKIDKILKARDERKKEHPKSSSTAIERYAQYIKDNALNGDGKMLVKLHAGQLTFSDALTRLRAENGKLFDVVNSHQGSAKPKASLSLQVYHNEVLQNDKFTPEDAFAVGGVRLQSFSDYIATMFVDYCQLIADYAAKGLPAHAYTKEIMFAKLFGLTGVKINLSLMPAIRQEDIDFINDYYVVEGKEKIDKETGEDKTNYTRKIKPEYLENYKIKEQERYDRQRKEFKENYKKNKKKGDPKVDVAWKAYVQENNILTGAAAMKVEKARIEARWNEIQQNAGLDADGNYIWAKETVGYAEAKNELEKSGIENPTAEQITQKAFDMAVELQKTKGYSSNVGTILVGISDKHIRKALRDPNIRMVIPYHKSSINPAIAMLTGIIGNVDYTEQQNTRFTTKDGNLKKVTVDSEGYYKEIRDKNGNRVKAFDDYEWLAAHKKADARDAANAYIDHCEKYGLTPKFEQFVYKEDGVTREEGYYKVLEDFNSFDCVTEENARQQAVQMRLPLAKNGDAFDFQELLEESLKEQQEVSNKLEKEISALVKQTAAAVKLTKKLPTLPTDRKIDTSINVNTEYGNAIPIADDAKYSKSVDIGDADYMAAVESGDVETAQRMVNEAAMKAGYFSVDGSNPLDLYHGTSKGGWTVPSLKGLKETDSQNRFFNLFTTSDIPTAKSYSYGAGRRQLAEYNDNVPSVENRGLAQEGEDYYDTLDRLYNDYHNAMRELADYMSRQKGVQGYIDDEFIDAKIEAAADDVYEALDEIFWDYICEIWEDNKRYAENVENGEYEYDSPADFEESEEGQELTKQFYSYGSAINTTFKNYNAWLSGSDQFEKENAVYHVFAKVENPFVFDAHNRAWNNLQMFPNIPDNWKVNDVTKLASSDYSVTWKGKQIIDENGNVVEELSDYDFERKYGKEHWRTRDVVAWAHENGYDGVIFKNILDDGGRGIEYVGVADYIVIPFKEQNIKSADAVTYDDEGNVIPLSERFSDKAELRYSKGVDIGTEEEYYDAYLDGDDEKAEQLVERAAKANGFTYKAYHYTNNAFTEFDRERARKSMDVQGFFFSASPTETKEYGDARYDVFLKMKNPYIVKDKETAQKAAVDYRREYGGVEARKRLQAEGYDGIIRKAEYYGGEEDEYVVFEPNQIKSAEPYTFDNNDELIPLSERFDAIENDIRYSQRVDIGDQSSLVKENAELKKSLEYYKMMYKGNSGHIVSRNKIHDIALRLKRDWGSTIPTKELEAHIANMYDFISSGNATWDVVKERGVAAVEELLSHEKKELTPEAQEVLNYMKEFTFSLTDEQKAEVEYYFGSMRNWMSKIGKGMKYRKDGMNIDSVWQELSAQYPNTFEKDTNSQDMAIQLAEITQGLLDTYTGTATDYYTPEELNTEILMDLWDSYFAIPEVVTPVDRAKRNLAKERLENKERLEKVKERYQKRYEALDNKFDKYKGRVKQQRENREASELKRRIRKQLNKILSMGANPTKDKHIPNGILSGVKALGEAILLDSDERYALATNKQDAKLREKLHAFRDGFEELETGEYTEYQMMSDAYNGLMKRQITELISKYGDLPIGNMPVDALRQINEMLKITLKTISNVNKLFNKQRNETISGYAASAKDALAKHKKDNAHNGLLSGFFYDNMKPVYFFDYLDNPALTELYQDLRDGEDTWITLFRETENFTKELRKRLGYNGWDFDKKQRFRTVNGAVELNLEELLAVYANTLGEHTNKNLLGGGFVYGTEKRSVSERIKGIKDSGISSLTKTRNDHNAHKVSLEDVQTMVDSLTDSQREYVRELIDFMSNRAAEWGNQVSRELYGVELFKEKQYYPAVIASDYRKSQLTDTSVLPSRQLVNSGFTKAIIPNVKNPIVLNGFDNTVMEHIVNMISYNSFVLPLENFNRVYHYVTVTNDADFSSVSADLKNAFGDKADAYINHLLEDINGGAMASTDYTNKLISLFKKNAVFASASVVVQQPSAIGRALSLIDAKYFLGNPVHSFKRSEYEEMKRYCPIAEIKELGYFDTGMALGAVDTLNRKEYDEAKERVKAFVTDGAYRDEAASFFAAKADEVTWTHIWNACKNEARDKYANLSDEEQKQKAAEKFKDVITRTQVYDSVFSRAGVMRNKNTGMKMATSFMAEPLTNLNMLVNAAVQTKRGNMSKAHGARVVGSLMVASILNSLFQTLVTAARHDKDDDDWKELYLAELLPNFIDNLNPINQIPLIRDAINIFKGYDVTRADMSIVTDLKKAFDNLSKDIPVNQKITGMAGAIGAFFGLPIRNVTRDIYAVINIGKDMFDKHHYDSANTEEKFKEEMNNTLGFELFTVGTKARYEKMFKLLKNGKSREAAQLLSEIKSLEAKKGKDETKVNSAIKTKYTEEFKNAFIKGNANTRSQIITYMAQSGVYGSREDVQEHVRKYWKEEK